MSQKLQICEQMAAVRSRGLVNARELGEEVERLGDWREHVRAHPVPLVLAAAALGYWAVPARRKKAEAPPLVGSGVAAREEKAKATTGMAGLLIGFATSLAGNAIRSYVSQQVQSLVQGKDDHASFVQRQASTHRY
jgi:hypothetical protein